MSGEARCPRCARDTCKPHLFKLNKINMYLRDDLKECADATVARAKAAEAERDAMRPVVEAAERQHEAGRQMMDTGHEEYRMAYAKWHLASRHTEVAIDTYRLARGKAGT